MENENNVVNEQVEATASEVETEAEQQTLTQEEVNRLIAQNKSKAKAQAETLKKRENDLTEKEKEIVKRGRNAENHHLPKNATVQEYMHSTGFEALIGYLYLTKQDERLKEILDKCVEK